MRKPENRVVCGETDRPVFIDCGSTPLRDAFTVLELLVSLLVVAVVVSLSLPSLAAAREASRRISCSNRIRQVGLAASMYESTWKVFPCAAGANWLAFRRIAAHMEVPTSASDPHEWPRRVAVPSTALSCPSDELPGTSYGGSNYLFNAGDSVPADHNGVWDESGRRVASRDVTDGLSQTALVSEHLVNEFNRVASDARVEGAIETVARRRPQTLVWRPTNRPDSLHLSDASVKRETCLSSSIEPANAYHPRNSNWIVEGCYLHGLPPNSAPCDLIGGGHVGPSQVMWTASSRHDRGVNVGFCDGSVRFASEEIDAEVWAAYGSRASGD